MMTQEHFLRLFREHLRECAHKKQKYHGQFTASDEERTVQTFQFVLDHPNLSDRLIFKQLTGEDSS